MSGRSRPWGAVTTLITLMFAAVLGTAALAQVQTGSILVKVADEQGAILPGASIVITSPALVAGQMTATSDEGGQWRFPSLSSGTYSVKVELAGFQGLVREGVPVQVGQTSPVDFTLADAHPGAPAILIVGASALMAPFKGGTLVPNPDLLAPVVMVGAGGSVSLAGTWAAGAPSGMQLFFQWWVADAAAAHGWAATAGVQLTVP